MSLRLSLFWKSALARYAVWPVVRTGARLIIMGFDNLAPVMSVTTASAAAGLRSCKRFGVFVLRGTRTPWMWVVAVAALALASRAGLFFGDAEVLPGGDNADYFSLASSIERGQFPTMVRMPGYPAFLWLASLLPGQTEDAAVTLQHLIGVGVAVGAMLLGLRFFGLQAGVIAGLLLAVSPLPIAVEDVLLPDFLFGAAAFAGAGTLALAAARPTPAKWLLVLTGLLFALAAYIKPVGQVLLLAPFLAFVTCGRPIRAWITAPLVIAAAMAVALAPWAGRNLITYGELSLTNQAGITLFNRAFEVQGLAVPTDDQHGRLVATLTAHAQATEGLRPSSYVPQALVGRGIPEKEAIAIQRRLATKAILRSPTDFARTSVQLTRSRLYDLSSVKSLDEARAHMSGSPAATRQLTEAVFDYGRVLQLAIFALTGHFVLVLLPLLLPGVARPAAAAFFAVGGLILAATVLTHGGMWRYSAQAAPEIWLLAAAGLVYVIGAIGARLRTDHRQHRYRTLPTVDGRHQ